MENQNQYNPVIPQQGTVESGQTVLPHSIAVLVTGIMSIQCSVIYGIPGIACSIVALILGGKSGNYLYQNPGMYTAGSVKMYRAGRTCAIIGLVLSIIMTIAFAFLLYYLIDRTDHNNYYQPPPPQPPHPVYR